MNAMALVFACLIALAPAVVAEETGETREPEQSDEVPCSFFSWTLTPPDYRINPDCPPIASLP